ncbi:monovalent cation:proton antiporter family protein [Thermoactinomyces sp. CICC 10521]|uniref:monovalent cation:proton antiporter family protein n=1 Tax=Thermoactinomyces sp. CICC 10521 TaxID=2767426 RepID=UPI0018DBCC1D|nr:cation:proton antiporter [Thermoactinomyces sp. CICC 10521]MBH8607670.1 cation:proton antiporter [Thermoactinomyces sp. CICC 10521]
MEGHHSLISLMIVVIAAFIVPIVLHRLKWNFIPVVVAEIVVGLVLGKSGFSIINQDNWLELLSMLGIIYLMFLSGLEIDFNMIFQSRKKEKGAPNPLAIGFISFLSIMLLAFGLSISFYVFGLVKAPFFMTLIISTISLSVTLPVIKDKGIARNTLGQSILVTAVIADFLTMILLAVYVSLRSPSGFKSILLLMSLFVIFFVVYRLIHTLKPANLTEKISKETISIGTRGVFALILFFVALSETVGAENILGAFLAGMIVSLLSPKKSFVNQLTAFGFGFLIPIFFVMVGAKLDLISLIKDPKALITFPLLLLSFYLSKVLVVFIFRRWFDWRSSIGSGFLLTSTLSLVIAGAAVGMDLQIITNTMNTALVLAAVVTAILSPILFQRIIPDAEEKQTASVALVGINAVTLKLSHDLHEDGYDVTLYGPDKSNLEHMNDRPFKICEMPVADPEHLDEQKVFDKDIVIAFTSDDRRNVDIAMAAEKKGVKQVIARVEDPKLQQPAKDSRIQFTSAFFSNTTLVKAMIEYPSLFRLVTDDAGYLMEIPLANQRYHLTRVRDLPFLGDTLIIRIFRGNEAIIPHGDTLLQVGDRLIISGSPEYVHKLNHMLQ